MRPFSKIKQLEDQISRLAISERREMLKVDSLERELRFLNQFQYHFSVNIHRSIEDTGVEIRVDGSMRYEKELFHNKSIVTDIQIEHAGERIVELERERCINDLIHKMTK